MKLTIITINLNNRDGLRRTMESVVSQTCQDFEYVVIDGGSTDGSREVIMEHQERLAYWCSEPDRGIYNAMNKGVAHATGDYCLFLNSGDYLYNKDVVKEVLPELDGRYDIVFGDLINENHSDHSSFLHKGNRGPYINSIWSINSMPTHPSSFINKHCLETEPYDEKYKIVSDKKFFVACFFLHNYSFHHVNILISVFNFNGISHTNFELSNKENNEMLAELFPERLINDISFLDPELLFLWSQIPTSYRLKRFLLSTNRLIINFYKTIKRLPVK